MTHVYTMGWLWLVGSTKLEVSFAKEPYGRDDVLQKRPLILWILLTVATPYVMTYTVWGRTWRWQTTFCHCYFGDVAFPVESVIWMGDSCVCIWIYMCVKNAMRKLISKIATMGVQLTVEAQLGYVTWLMHMCIDKWSLSCERTCEQITVTEVQLTVEVWLWGRNCVMWHGSTVLCDTSHACVLRQAICELMTEISRRWECN